MTVGARLQARYDEISNEMKSMELDAAGYKKDRSDEISNEMKSHAAPEHKADRESMSKPDYLHAVNSLLCPVPDKDGRYRGRWINDAKGGCVSAQGVNMTPPGVAAAPPSVATSVAIP